MLSLFPTMFLGLLAHALLRIVTGGVLFILGSETRKHAKALPRTKTKIVLLHCAIIELCCGLMLIVGIFTQAVALVVLLYAVTLLLFHKRLAAHINTRGFYVLLCGISLSLFITGAGAFAVDLPF